MDPIIRAHRFLLGLRHLVKLKPWIVKSPDRMICYSPVNELPPSLPECGPRNPDPSPMHRAFKLEWGVDVPYISTSHLGIYLRWLLY